MSFRLSNSVNTLIFVQCVTVTGAKKFLPFCHPKMHPTIYALSMPIGLTSRFPNNYDLYTANRYISSLSAQAPRTTIYSHVKNRNHQSTRPGRSNRRQRVHHASRSARASERDAPGIKPILEGLERVAQSWQARSGHQRRRANSGPCKRCRYCSEEHIYSKRTY